MADTTIGKKAESKIREWLDKPEVGYSFDRIPDQMTGKFGSKNICDFTCFKSPNMYYIESKATWEDRFDFANISPTQHEGLLNKSRIPNVYGLVIVLFASHKRAFMFLIEDIDKAATQGIKSLNINKRDSWELPCIEIHTVHNSRKQLLDYTGPIEDYVQYLITLRSNMI